MEEKLDAIDVLEQSRARWVFGRFRRAMTLYLIKPALAVQFDKFRDLAAVNLRRRKSQFLLKSLFQSFDITVFAKDQRDNEPIVARTDLAVVPVIAEKCAIPPPRYVGRSPMVFARFLVEGQCVVPDVACVQRRTLRNVLGCFSDEHAIHENRRSNGQVSGRKFMFGEYV